MTMSTPKILSAPDSIWLCYGDIIEDEVHEQDGDNITWCEMAQDHADVKYIRADIVEALQKEVAALKDQMHDLQTAATSAIQTIEGAL